MDIVIRAAAAYFFILLLTRVIGRRELSSLEPYDLILLVAVGDLIQQGVTQSDYSITGAFLAVGTFGMLTLLVSWLAFRFRRLRPLLDGEPIILIQDGRLFENNMKRERLSREDVAEEARAQQIESLDDVKWAVLETGGQISFIPKSG